MNKQTCLKNALVSNEIVEEDLYHSECKVLNITWGYHWFTGYSPVLAGVYLVR